MKQARNCPRRDSNPSGSPSRGLISRGAGARKSAPKFKVVPIVPIARYLSLPEGAAKLTAAGYRCSPKKLRALIIEGPIPGSWVGERLKIWSADLDAFIKTGRREWLRSQIAKLEQDTGIGRAAGAR